MTLTTYRRATALGERAWDRCWARVRRGLEPRATDRARWRRMMDRAAAELERAARDARAYADALAAERTKETGP